MKGTQYSPMVNWFDQNKSRKHNNFCTNPSALHGFNSEKRCSDNVQLYNLFCNAVLSHLARDPTPTHINTECSINWQYVNRFCFPGEKLYAIG